MGLSELLGKLSTASEQANPTAIFTKASYANIANINSGNSQYAVVITPLGMPPIKGVLKEPLKYSISAQWEALDALEAITSNFGLANTMYKYGMTVMNAGGISDPSKLGLSSKQIYKNSGYLTLNLSMRIVDWLGNSDPINASQLLSNATLPRKINQQSLTQVAASLRTDVGSLIDKILDMTIFSGGIKQEDKDKLKAYATAIGQTVTDEAGKAAASIFASFGPEAKAAYDQFVTTINSADFFVIASSPPSVTLEVGGYFENTDMIIKEVASSFSKQCSAAGPLWVDLDIELSSQQALLAGEDGNNFGIGITSTSNMAQRTITIGAPSIPSPNSLVGTK